MDEYVDKQFSSFSLNTYKELNDKTNLTDVPNKYDDISYSSILLNMQKS